MNNTVSESYQEIIPAVLPFFHIYGLNGQMLPNLRIGIQLVTLPKFTPKTFMDVFTSHKVRTVAHTHVKRDL